MSDRIGAFLAPGGLLLLQVVRLRHLVAQKALSARELPTLPLQVLQLLSQLLGQRCGFLVSRLLCSFHFSPKMVALLLASFQNLKELPSKGTHESLLPNRLGKPEFIFLVGSMILRTPVWMCHFRGGGGFCFWLAFNGTPKPSNCGPPEIPRLPEMITGFTQFVDSTCEAVLSSCFAVPRERISQLAVCENVPRTEPTSP